MRTTRARGVHCTDREKNIRQSTINVASLVESMVRIRSHDGSLRESRQAEDRRESLGESATFFDSLPDERESKRTIGKSVSACLGCCLR
jgi:hypothetical protein